MRLEDKIAIVTGAGQTPGETLGNGRATALLFAREGAAILAVDRKLERAQETATQIEKEGGRCVPHEADISKEDDCMALATACKGEFGRIDILHNNVGIGAGDGGAMDFTSEGWDRIFGVNLKGPFLTCKHVLPVMKEQGKGAIVTISSVAALANYRGVGYKTTKAGLHALNEIIAMSGARYGIRANVIMPGLIDTPMAIEGIAAATGKTREDLRAERNKAVPLGKMGTAWDVAYAALFLASDEAKFITGAVLPVDGGQLLKVG
jgi:NAD(P)-dependent dehydrogenase (short-subunit alcohol dehydrogenase family)